MTEALDLCIHKIKFYTDSRIVLGYIHNRTRRFYTYISNRVAKIHNVSVADQWNYIPTHMNPADNGTRGVPVDNLQDSKWLTGPSFLLKSRSQDSHESDHFPLINPDEDTEVRKEAKVLVCATKVCVESLGTERMEDSHPGRTL